MTNPTNHDHNGHACNCGHNHVDAENADRVITPQGTDAANREVVETERITPTAPANPTNPEAGTDERNNLGLTDANATGSCDCAPGECKCGHHQTCDCAPGECNCGHHHGNGEAGVPDHGDCECQQCRNADAEARKERGENQKDFTNPDTVNADGTNPAVQTVNKAEGYDENAGWNDGIEPAESSNPQSYEESDDNVN